MYYHSEMQTEVNSMKAISDEQIAPEIVQAIVAKGQGAQLVCQRLPAAGTGLDGQCASLREAFLRDCNPGRMGERIH